MNTERKNILKGVVLGGMIVSAIPGMANGNKLLEYNLIGTGSELRSSLLKEYGAVHTAANATSNDFIVGETKCGENKCGEGKGEKEPEKKDKKESKESMAKAKTKDESKAAEATCGEKGKKEATTESKDKTTEAKCGENTCGGK